MIKYFYINDVLGEVELDAKTLEEASVEIANRYLGYGEATVEAREYSVKYTHVYRVGVNNEKSS